MLGVAWFAATTLALHAGSGALDVGRHYVSDFATGSGGLLFRVGVLGHAVGNVALVIGLHRSVRDGALEAWASGLFLLATVGMAITGLWNTDPFAAAPSAAGAIHRMAASSAFSVELVALFLYSAAFAAQTRWRAAVRVSLAMSAGAAGASAMLLSAIVLDWRPGIAERAALATFMGWEFWAGVQLALGPRRRQGQIRESAVLASARERKGARRM
jgi:hypothetical protein